MFRHWIDMKDKVLMIKKLRRICKLEEKQIFKFRKGKDNVCKMLMKWMIYFLKENKVIKEN